MHIGYQLIHKVEKGKKSTEPLDLFVCMMDVNILRIEFNPDNDWAYTQAGYIQHARHVTLKLRLNVHVS